MKAKFIPILVFTLYGVSALSAMAASKNFETLKYLLSTRTQEPKMYLPSGVVLGQNIEVTILAPGAEYIKLLSSLQEGVSDFEDTKLRLAGDINLVGEQGSERAEFRLNLNQENFSEMVGKKLYFDAIAYYKDEETGKLFSKPVLVYGANAGASITNGVQILSIPKDHSNLAASARTFLPGLNRANF